MGLERSWDLPELDPSHLWYLLASLLFFSANIYLSPSSPAFLFEGGGGSNSGVTAATVAINTVATYATATTAASSSTATSGSSSTTGGAGCNGKPPGTLSSLLSFFCLFFFSYLPLFSLLSFVYFAIRMVLRGAKHSSSTAPMLKCRAALLAPHACRLILLT